MTDFSHITNWKLRRGSHKFPGPDGGTCINEAAIVAAGFEYRSVSGAEDFPECFCPVLGSAALVLNDKLFDDHARNTLLMPFVTRLSGSRDSAYVETMRADLILGGVFGLCMNMQPQRRSMPPPYPGMSATGVYADYSSPFWDAPYPMKTGAQTRYTHDSFEATRYLREKLQRVLADASRVRHASSRVAHIAGMLSRTHEVASPPEMESIFALSVGVLAAAFAIGNQAPPLEHAKVIERMDEARKAVHEAVEA